MTDDGLIFDNVTISRGGRRLVAISTHITPGEVTTIMGPSGAGKSTILALVTGTIDRSFSVSGRILLNGRDLTGLSPQERRIGMMFQDDILFPHLSVGGNLAFGLRPETRRRDARKAAIDAALEDAGLSGYASRDPATLSGGQRARVALMRVLLSKPNALLLDEPFSKLDAALRDQIRNFVFDHARANRLPTLLVTHDPGDAAATGGPVIKIGGAAT